MSDVITRAITGEERGYKTCRCFVCGIEAKCTPRFDFYAKNDGDPLKCERCFWGHLADQGVKRLPDEMP